MERPPRLRGGSVTINLDAKQMRTQTDESLDALMFTWWESHFLPSIWHPRPARGEAPAA